MAIRSTMSVLGLFNYDSTLFDNLQLPQGVERDVAIRDILYQCADLELWIPDWAVLKDAIGVWSTKNAWKWQKMLETMQFEYNPIWNKDGTITETNSGTNTGTIQAEHQVSGYNVNTYSPESKNITTPNTAWGETRSRTEQGNIGLTSTQELIRQEREVSDFSIYKIITRDFKEEFCLLVY